MDCTQTLEFCMNCLEKISPETRNAAEVAADLLLYLQSKTILRDGSKKTGAE